MLKSSWWGRSLVVAVGLGTALAFSVRHPSPRPGQERPAEPAAETREITSERPETVDSQQGIDIAGDAWGDGEREAEAVSRRSISLEAGETLMELLRDAKVPQGPAQEAVTALRGVYDPSRLKAGQEFQLLFDPQEGGRFIGFEFQPNAERQVNVSLNGNRFQAAQTAKPVTRTLVAAAGRINSSLFEAGAAAGVPVTVLSALIKHYSYDVDFQRDIQPGDRFEILFERFITEEGEVARDGEILFASLTLSGKRQPIYRFGPEGEVAEFYTAKGESIRKALLRTPVDGARITSGFGMRMHPVLGYSKAHKGVDFGAPTGTPIYAAGSGTVEEVGPKGSYGNYVRIRHNREISTAYAHMSRFGQGIRAGQRVSQGQVIGYVGATGRVTGAHLHYEVLKADHQVNPLSVEMPAGRNLEGRDKTKFDAQVKALEAQFHDELAKAAGGVALVSSRGAVVPARKPGCGAEGC